MTGRGEGEGRDGADGARGGASEEIWSGEIWTRSFNLVKNQAKFGRGTAEISKEAGATLARMGWVILGGFGRGNLGRKYWR